MANMINGVYLNDRYYNFDSESYRQSSALKNSVNVSQRRRQAQINGLDLISHSVTLHLESIYNPFDAGSNNQLGETTWLGVSRLQDLRNFVGALGSSMPLIFITPYGSTHYVIGTGSLDVTLFRPYAGDAIRGREFRVSLTLEDIR